MCNSTYYSSTCDIDSMNASSVADPLECSLNLFEISLINWSKSSIEIACLKYLSTEHVLTLQQCYYFFVMQGLILIYLNFVQSGTY